MHIVEKPTADPIAPLHHFKTKLLSKGYTHKQIQEDGAIISIFKAAALDDLNAASAITILHEN